MSFLCFASSLRWRYDAPGRPVERISVRISCGGWGGWLGDRVKDPPSSLEDVPK